MNVKQNTKVFILLGNLIFLRRLARGNLVQKHL